MTRDIPARVCIVSGSARFEHTLQVSAPIASATLPTSNPSPTRVGIPLTGPTTLPDNGSRRDPGGGG